MPLMSCYMYVKLHHCAGDVSSVSPPSHSAVFLLRSKWQLSSATRRLQAFNQRISSVVSRGQSERARRGHPGSDADAYRPGYDLLNSSFWAGASHRGVTWHSVRMRDSDLTMINCYSVCWGGIREMRESLFIHSTQLVSNSSKCTRAAVRSH